MLRPPQFSWRERIVEVIRDTAEYSGETADVYTCTCSASISIIHLCVCVCNRKNYCSVIISIDANVLLAHSHTIPKQVCGKLVCAGVVLYTCV